MSRMIYIASPYTGDVDENIKRACFAGDVLLDRGYIPFIPHLSHLYHQISPKPYETWLRLDLAYLQRCDAILRLKGESRGADTEVDIAKRLGIPVYYKEMK